MESIILTISERLEDLRKKHGLTLEELAEATKISKSALSKYENQDFKDISPFNVATLAKFYGVTTDYLLGVSNMERPDDAEIQELRLANEALNVLKGGGFNGLLLSEVISHKDFRRLMVDMEIFVDHIVQMQVNNLNYGMGTARGIVERQYHPDENELFYRTAELGKIPADEYVSSVLRDDLTGILRDIRDAHPKRANDEADTSPFDAIEKFQKKVQSVIESEESPEKRVAKIYLTAWGIDYNDLTPEQVVVLVEILEKSKLKENSINRRGRNQPLAHKKRKK